MSEVTKSDNLFPPLKFQEQIEVNVRAAIWNPSDPFPPFYSAGELAEAGEKIVQAMDIHQGAKMLDTKKESTFSSTTTTYMYVTAISTHPCITIIFIWKMS